MWYNQWNKWLNSIFTFMTNSPLVKLISSSAEYLKYLAATSRSWDALSKRWWKSVSSNPFSWIDFAALQEEEITFPMAAAEKNVNKKL